MITVLHTHKHLTIPEGRCGVTGGRQPENQQVVERIGRNAHSRHSLRKQKGNENILMNHPFGGCARQCRWRAKTITEQCRELPVSHRVQESRPPSQVGQGHLVDGWPEHANLCQEVRQHNVAWIPWKSSVVERVVVAITLTTIRNLRSATVITKI